MQIRLTNSFDAETSSSAFRINTITPILAIFAIVGALTYVIAALA
jgi:hypothetical protein